MNRNLEAILFREHESRMSSLRGSELPKGEHGLADADTRREKEAAREERDRRIVELATAHRDLSASEIGRRLEVPHSTVLTVLKRAGIKTKPKGWAP